MGVRVAAKKNKDVLFRLKEVVTLQEAAVWLSLTFDEPVSDRDVVQFALEGRLRLSVDLVNSAWARRGTVVGEQGIVWREVLADFRPAAAERLNVDPGKPLLAMMSLSIDDKRFLNLEDKVQKISGVWDLPMIGAEKIQIKNAFLKSIRGPVVKLMNLEGAFVEHRDGSIWQIQEPFSAGEAPSTPPTPLQSIKRKHGKGFAVSPPGDNGFVDEDVALHAARQKSKRQSSAWESDPNEYHPAPGIPSGSLVVVRTSALRDFESSYGAPIDGSERPVAPKERSSLLKIIAALCQDMGIDVRDRGATTEVLRIVESSLRGAVTDDTIRSVLNQISKIEEVKKT